MVCLGAASVALVGRATGIGHGIWPPGFPETSVESAVGMLGLGLALLLLVRPGGRRRWLAYTAAAGAVAAGVVGILQQLLGLDGFDPIPVPEAVEPPYVRRLSAYVALILIGGGLLGLRARRFLGALAQGALLLGFFLSLVATHAWMQGALDLLGPPEYQPFTGMGVLSAVGLLAASLGAMLAEPANPLTRWLPEPTSAGAFVRFAGLVIVLLLPFALSALLATGREAGFYGPRTLVALFGSLFTLGSAAAVASVAHTIDRRERERRQLLELEREAREATERERARLAAVLESAPVGILFVDARSGAASGNPALARMLHRRPVGPAAGLGRILEPGGAPLPRAELPSTRVLAGEALCEQDYRILRPDGGSFPVSVMGVPIRGPGGAVEGACLTFYDTSSREKLDQLREQYLSLVSHDLSSPVASIMMGAQLVEEQLESAGLPTRTAFLIRRNAHRVHDMIEDLNDVTRLESGMVRLRPRSLDVGRLLETVVEHAVPPAERERVRIDVHPAVGRIVGDPDQLERVLTNLLNNARKHGASDAPIDVRAALEPEGVRLSIHNRGPGLEAEDARRIFDKHYRIGDGRSRGAGLGLGLYISRLITEAHGGRIWAESPGGEGVTVHVLLPGPSRVAIPLSA